ncbi:Oxygen regulatory protein NreC [compost metagenome]
MEEKKRIVLVDDHVIVRNGLKELIEKIGPYSVVNQFDSGTDFLAQLPPPEQTDLIIMDLNMPGIGGDEVASLLKEQGYTVPLMILTLNSDESTIIRLFRNGVRGFLKKDCSADTLKTALSSVFQFGYFHNEFLALSLQNPGTGEEMSNQEKILRQLTQREREFLKLVCHEDEYTYDQIASEMNVQHRTVDGYRQSVFEKFEIKSKTGLVLFVLKHRLFDQL